MAWFICVLFVVACVFTLYRRNVAVADKMHVRFASNAQNPSIQNSLLSTVIPPGYNRLQHPHNQGNPVEIELGVSIAAITDLRESKLDMEFVVYLITSWTDPRLAFSSDVPDPWIVFTAKEFSSFWIPDIHIRNAKSVEIVKHLNHDGTGRLYRNGTISIDNRYMVTVICNYYFKTYPFDTQKCNLEIESYILPVEHLHLSVRDSGMESDMPPLPQFAIIQVLTNDCTEAWDLGGENETYSCVRMVVELKRRYSFFMWSVYIPSILIVAISWFAFWIKADQVAGRVALGITTLLTLVTQFMYVQRTLPPVSYLKALDVWMFSCIFTVFLSLVEFVTSYTYFNRCKEAQQHRKEHRKIFSVPCDVPSFRTNTVVLHDFRHTNEFHEATSNQTDISQASSTIKFTSETKKTDTQVQQNKVDAFSKFLFPIIFLSFNLAYWVVYVS